MTLAQKLSRYAARLRYSDIPSEVIHEAKKHLIDSIACAISAFDSHPGKIARKLASAQTGLSTLIGTRRKSSAGLAAFANSTLIRYWDYNDTYLSKEPAHPSDNIGALLAVAESERVSGKDLITALVLSYEIQCRLCDSASLRVRGWDHVTFGAFSVACGVGLLMRLRERSLEQALNLAGVANVALRQTRVGEISDWKASAFANAARNGLFACELARAGMSGPAPIFEGEKGFENLVSGPIELAELGGKKTSFKILQTYIKFYPVEYHAQAAVEAALSLYPRVKNIRKIRSIEIDTYDVAVEIIARDPEKWKPRSRETADHSLPYAVARSLWDGKMNLASYTPNKIRDVEVLALMKKIKVNADHKMTQDYPHSLPCRIRIREKGEELLEDFVEYPRGHFKNPMTDEEVNQKFLCLTGPYLSCAQQSRALQMLWHFENIESWNNLMKQLVIQ